MSHPDFQDVQNCFHLPINIAAKNLGISVTILKSLCRKNKIKRWPYRKIHALKIIIRDLQNELQKLERKTNLMSTDNKTQDNNINAKIIENLIKKINDNQKNLQQLYENPDIGFTTLIDKTEYKLLKSSTSRIITSLTPNYEKKLILENNLTGFDQYLPESKNSESNNFDICIHLMEQQVINILVAEKRKQKQKLKQN